MNTLLIELAGPFQSWGSRSRFATRATELAPTKSAVVGLVAAACGLQRTDPLDQFDGVRFGVRVDQPGRVERDFQTEISLDGTSAMPLSHRYYLADAVFLAGLQSDDEARLDLWRHALTRPVYPLFLGRRAFPPAGPVRTTLVTGTLEHAFAGVEWRASARHQKATRDERVSLATLIDADADDPTAETLRDEPISFDPRRREYGWRAVAHGRVEVANPLWHASTPHDPMALLTEGQ